MRQTIDDTGLELLTNDAWVHHAAAIANHGDFVHLDIATIDRDFGDLSHVSTIAFHQRDAQCTACRQFLAPACFVSSDLQHVRKARLFAEQLHTVLDWIFTSSVCQLVHERFVSEAVHGVRHSAQVTNTDAGVMDDQIVRCVWHIVRRNCCLNHEWIQGVFRQTEQHLSDRLRADLMLDRNWLARCVQTTFDTVQALRTIPVVLHVVFTRPQNFDRTTRCLRQLSSLHHEVSHDTTTETTTEEGSTDGNVFWLQANRSSSETLCALLELGWADQFALVARHDRNHVHWLERLVSHVLSVVLSLQNFGSTFQRVVSVADVRTHLDRGDRLLSSFGAIPHCFSVQVCTWAEIPLNLQRLTCFECTPVAVSHDTNAAVDFVDADDAWQATNCGVIEALWLAADDWRHFDRSVDQTRHFDIDTELGGTVDFCWSVQTRDCLTNDVELASVFQLNFFWYRDR